MNRSVTFTHVNRTVSINTNKCFLNEYLCTRSIFNTWSNDDVNKHKFMTLLNWIDQSFLFDFFTTHVKLAIESVDIIQAINHVEMNMYIMYKLICITYNDHHEKLSIVNSVMSTMFWKFVCPTLFKYHGNIAKTGDKSPLLLI